MTPEEEWNDVFVVNTAIECNNIGAELASSGRLRQALETFVGALTLLRYAYNGLDELISAISTDSGFNYIEQQQNGATIALSRRRRGDQCSTNLYEARRKLGDLYSSPTVAIVENELCYDPLVLDFIEEETAGRRTQPKSFHREAAAVASNVGLIYQLYADAPSFQRSICIYDFAFSLARSAKQTMPSVDFTRIACRCLFNSGVIHHDLGNLQQSRKCISSLGIHVNYLPYGPEKRSALDRLQFTLTSFSSK